MQLGRGGLIRSRRGCKTCRIRHVKCDETRPYCQCCQKTGRKCDGYNIPPPGNDRLVVPPKAFPGLPKFDDSRQKEFFALFVSYTTDASSVYFGANFWSRRVLQLSLSDPAVRYALCSLSALHRMSLAPNFPTFSNPGYTAAELQDYSLRQYNHAINSTRRLLAESSDGSEENLVKGLVACALFVCYETFTGNLQVSYMHLQNGLRIITRESRRSHVPKDILQVFKRLELQAVSFGDTRVPDPGTYNGNPIDLELWDPKPLGSTCIDDSIDVVLHLFKWLFCKMGGSGSCPISPEDLKAATQALERWNTDIEPLFRVTDTKRNNQMQRSMILLRIYQIIMTVIIATGVHGRETLHDHYLRDYQEVVDLANKLLLGDLTRSGRQFFCFDIGIIFPLHWVATKCRESKTRRRAAQLLGDMNHQEGAWKSTAAAKVADFVIMIEEEGLPSGGVQPHEVPEAARVHLVDSRADTKTGDILLNCWLKSDYEVWYIRKGRVTVTGELLTVEWLVRR